VPLILHVIADCPSDGAAAALLQTLLGSLSAWTPKSREVPQRYWKRPECFAFLLELEPPTLRSYAAVRALAGGSWSDLDAEEERSAVWNRGSEGPFLSEEVIWAELLLYP
jgi:hypothetical protein